MITLYNQIAGRSLERIAAPSDGVFAISMTLVVLEIRVPDPGPVQREQDLWTALVTLLPRLITYLPSLITLGIFWSGQQTQFNYFARADRSLSRLDLTLLALLLSWANILFVGAILDTVWSYALHTARVKGDLPPGASRAIKRRIVVAQTLYAFGALL